MQKVEEYLDFVWIVIYVKKLKTVSNRLGCFQVSFVTV